MSATPSEAQSLRHRLGTRNAAGARSLCALRNDPEQWADYQQELRLTENTAADGLSTPEYPEYNR